jgi:hypothetical protein
VVVVVCLEEEAEKTPIKIATIAIPTIIKRMFIIPR